MTHVMVVTLAHAERGGEAARLTKSRGYNRVSLPTLTIFGNEPVVWVADKAELRVGDKVVNTQRR
jgi:hypothetical protein